MLATSATGREEERALVGLFASLRRGGAVGPESRGIAVKHHAAPPALCEDEPEYAIPVAVCKQNESI